MSKPADLPAPSFPATTAAPTLVEHRETGTRFILLGTGYGLALDTRPGLFTQIEKKPCDMMVCVCDARGEMAGYPLYRCASSRWAASTRRRSSA
ncbi:MAG: hypothetical protein AAGF23_24390 [Acidobacteriota bacterium]